MLCWNLFKVFSSLSCSHVCRYVNVMQEIVV